MINVWWDIIGDFVVQGGPKNCLRVDNFATVSGRMVCDTSNLV